MKLKIDTYLLQVARLHPDFPEILPAEEFGRKLYERMEEAGLIDDPDEAMGNTISYITGHKLVADVARVLCDFLPKVSISSDVFDAFRKITIMGDGDCPDCGGWLDEPEEVGEWVRDSDPDIAPVFRTEYYVYTCPVCGKQIKTNKKL